MPKRARNWAAKFQRRRLSRRSITATAASSRRAPPASPRYRARAESEGAAGRVKCREALCLRRAALAAPRRIFRPTRSVSALLAPGVSPGGCGEPRIVAACVETRVPDLQPALDPDAPGPTPMGEAGCGES